MRLRLAGSLFALTLASAATAAAQDAPPPTASSPQSDGPPSGSGDPFRGPHGRPHPGAHHPPMGPDGEPHDARPASPHAQRVPVTVESTNPAKDVVLERRVKIDETMGRTLFLVPHGGSTQTWEQVCVAPCTVDLDRSSTYRVSHENSVTRSGTFTLPPTAPSVKLEVEPGNYWWHAVGTRLIAGGTAAAIVGGALITAAHTWDSHDSEVDVRTAGIVTGAIGLAFLAAGIPIAILTRTHVKANDKKVGSLKPPPPKVVFGGVVF